MNTQQQAAEVAFKKIAGFVSKARLRRLECDWLEPEECADRFAAIVDTKMTIDEVDALSRLIASNPSFSDLWAVLTPRVREWNAMALDLASGEYAPVPPPAEIGEQAFRVVDPIITTWLAFALKQVALGGDLKKEVRQSTSTPEPASANG